MNEDSLKERLEWCAVSCASIRSTIKRLIAFGPYEKNDLVVGSVSYKEQLENDLGKLLFTVAMMAEHKDLDYIRILEGCANYAKKAGNDVQHQDLDVLQYLQNQIEGQLIHEKNEL